VALPKDESLADSSAEDVIAVEGLRGEIFAFLGPNGAGKTTTVEILEGFRERTGGTVSVLGVDPSDGGREWRNRICAVMQESSAEPGLTVRESLELHAGYYDKPRAIDETIALVGLAAKGRCARRAPLRRTAPPPRGRARAHRQPGADLRGRAIFEKQHA
jgi:ABC-type multidrug transport system ATPase subunit